MIGHVDRNIIDLTVPLKHLDGLLENVPDVELVLPLEAVDVALAESDEVSLLAVPAQAQQEVLPVLTASNERPVLRVLTNERRVLPGRCPGTGGWRSASPGQGPPSAWAGQRTPGTHSAPGCWRKLSPCYSTCPCGQNISAYHIISLTIKAYPRIEE